MISRAAIGKRIKELRNQNGYSQAYVAQQLFISQAAYSLIESGQNGIVTEHIIKLSKIYKVTTDFILTGNTHLVSVTPENGFVPFIKAEAHAGFLKYYNRESPSFDCDWYRIPGFPPEGDQKLFEVEGKSMLPTILPGEVIICQKQPQIRNVLDGSVVLVITNNEILIKRLYFEKGSDYLLLESDNSQLREGQHRLKFQDVNELMLIKGKITSLLGPQNDRSSHEKINALEKASELLKNELNVMKEKLHSIQ